MCNDWHSRSRRTCTRPRKCTGGDDDQNIYAFTGASISFIRRFEEDYRAKPKFLTENYRSTSFIIDAANQVIEPARGRMKAGHPITVDKLRGLQPGGGAMATYDPVGRGRVQFLDVDLPRFCSGLLRAILATKERSAVESFFTALKAELVWRRNWQTRRDVEIALFKYINGFYNPRRKHSALGWKSPVPFEQRAA